MSVLFVRCFSIHVIQLLNLNDFKFHKTAVWRTAKSPAAKTHDLEVWSTLTSLHSWVMGSAYQLTERNIRVIFNENLTNGWGDLKDTKFKGNFHDLEVWPWPWVCVAESLVLHNTSLRGTFRWSLTKIVQSVLEIWSGHKLKVNPMTLNCDLDLESV